VGWQTTSSAPAAFEQVNSVEPPRSPDEFAAVAGKHRVMLRRYALHLSGNATVADDLVQDTLLRAMPHFDKLKPETNHAAWLVRILGNLFIDRVRHRDVEDKAQPELIMRIELEPEPPLATVSDAVLRAAIAQLEPTLREVIELRYFRGLKYLEISRKLNLPVSTVGTRLLRAQARLAEILAPARPKAVSS
jgi:RNA polymerase sigma-70 factor (ECF subfamily)